MSFDLEYIRGEIRAERISYEELLWLQCHADDIDPGDVELLEWAGVPEFPEDDLEGVMVPVTLLFRAPAGHDPDDLRRFVENVFEHGTIRDVFAAAIDGADRDPLAYDGYIVENPPPTIPDPWQHPDLHDWQVAT